MRVFIGRTSLGLCSIISVCNSVVIELNQLLVSAKVMQLKRARETNLLQIGLEECCAAKLRKGHREKGGSEGGVKGARIHFVEVAPCPELES